MRVRAGVAAIVFEVIEKPGDQRGVEVGKVQLGRLLASPLRRIAQQQPECVSVSGDRARASVLLVDQPLNEERLECRGERGYDRAPSSPSRRAATSSSSSGTACRYQYVCSGLACPSMEQSSGSFASTSSPSRYQSRSVATA